MPKKKTELAPVVSSVVSRVVVKSVKKAPAKPRAKKVLEVEPKKSKPVTHRHKKLEAMVEAVTVAAAVEALTPEQIHNAIGAIAYSYYEERGYRPGSPDEDWVRAEREFWSRLAK